MATHPLSVSRRSALRGAAVGRAGALIPCDIHRIEAADPYPDSYDASVARNVEGLAVKGEEVTDAGAAIQTWLQRTQLLQAQ